MGRVKVIVSLIPRNIAELEEIGFTGKASNGYRQSFEFALDKAIEEFIKKYG
jgi:hypothetical protein